MFAYKKCVLLKKRFAKTNGWVRSLLW